MKMKCTRITHSMAYGYERDADGAKAKNEKGQPIWKQMPRWDISFEIIGDHRKLSGGFNLNTTYPEQAARYVLHGVYEFSDISPRE